MDDATKRECIQEIFDWAAKRDEKLEVWLRQLILLGSGGLTLSVSLHPGEGVQVLSEVLLKGAWLCICFGILANAVRLYSLVHFEKSKTSQLSARRIKEWAENLPASGDPITATLPKWMKYSEHAAYMLYTIGILLMTASFLCR